ncbi:hypothetical protein BN3590_04221 [Clostridium sp. C105KSO15]|nr:hypothetical protein BN3590_04221 [Clostridium sp. C105KSO15]
MVGMGTHKELLKSCNIYYEIADSQLTKEELELSLIHISEPTRLGMISYAVFCLKKKKNTHPATSDTSIDS